MEIKHCRYCNKDKPVEKFRLTRHGNRANKCLQCTYRASLNEKKPEKYVSMSEREKLKIGRES